MKKAKQILSLMLVIAMALGMMVFVPGTASAKSVNDYPDADNIEHKEAVDVLSALGVFVGDDGGFRPQDSITREEAAKVITYILIGSTAAERLAPRTSSFTDVATDRWSNKYIEYCVEKGIIKGYGDGNFGPADKVTASQMAKMLLVCIGYGAMGEYDNPNSWELNTIVDAQRRYILTLDEDYTQPATREQVALYTFNALVDADLVTYSDLAKQYLNAGSNIFNNADETTLGAEVFYLYPYYEVDSLGYTGRHWERRVGQETATPLTGFYRTDVTLATSTNGSPIVDSLFGLTSVGSMGFKVRLEPYKDYNGYNVPVEFYRNGTLVGTTDDKNVIPADAETSAKRKGTIVELIDRNSDGFADKVVMIEKTVSVVLTDPTVTYGAPTINGISVNGSSSFAPGKCVYPEDLKAGDIVLYYTDKAMADGSGGVTYVEKAESVSGTLTARNVANNVVTASFGGKSYSASGLSMTLANDYEGFDAFTTNVNGQRFNLESTAYLDNGGNIIAFKLGAEADLNYLVLLDFEGGGLSTSGQILLPDGSTRIVNISRYTDAAKVTTTSKIWDKLKNVDGYNPGTPAIFSYTIDANGNFTIKEVAGATYDSTTWTWSDGIRDIPGYDDTFGGTVVSPAATFVQWDPQTVPYAYYAGSLTGNDSTVFLIAVKDGSGNIVSFKSVTGVKNAPTYTSTNKTDGGTAVVVNGIVQLVYFGGAPKAVDQNMLFFLDLADASTIWDDGTKYYSVPAFDSEIGESRNVLIDESEYESLMTNVPYTTGYFPVAYTDGIITSIGKATSGSGYRSGTNVSTPKNGVITMSYVPYRYNSNTKVYFGDLAIYRNVTLSSIGAIVGNANTSWFAKFGDTNNPDLITELYIVTTSLKETSTYEVRYVGTATSKPATLGDNISTIITGLGFAKVKYDGNDDAVFTFNPSSYQWGILDESSWFVKAALTDAPAATDILENDYAPWGTTYAKGFVHIGLFNATDNVNSESGTFEAMPLMVVKVALTIPATPPTP